jgi:GNAT superfamily N-acetyltransferase
MSSPHVRPAAPADAPELARLRYEFRTRLGPAVEAEDDFTARCAAWMTARLADGGGWHAWIATRDEAIVGTIWLEQIEKMPNPTPESETHAYITNVYVRESERGAGLGSALLAAAVQWCEESGVHAAILWPTYRSVPLYARHGFAPPDALLERTFGPGPDRGPRLAGER